jgi:hypothetical protein
MYAIFTVLTNYRARKLGCEIVFGIFLGIVMVLGNSCGSSEHRCFGDC